MKTIQGNLIVKNYRIGIVTTRWNQLITERLVHGAKESFIMHGGESENLTLVYVPGTVEIPLCIKKMAASKKYDAIVALGVVIQGETQHHETVENFATSGISRISHDFEIPIGLGVLTPTNLEQAFDRSGAKLGNKGSDAMLAVIEMLDLLNSI